MKQKLSFKEYVYVASMLFGMFFGAGNLIFPVDMGQMALFDTAKDEDILKELSEMEIASMTPLEALNTLNRLQSKLKNRWSVTGVQG